MASNKPLAAFNDYITFPAVPTKVVTVCWYQNSSTWREEEYYSAPCFTKNSVTNVSIRTTIFIAREWVDKFYYFAPEWTELRKSHILSLDGKTVAESQDVTNKWVETKITKNFFYGQDKADSATSRWIVYHPADRNPSQGRFVRNLVMEVADEVAAVVNSTSVTVSQASTGTSFASNLPGDVIKKLMSMGIAKFGHQLHRFGEDHPELKLEVSDEDYRAMYDQLCLLASQGKVDIAITGMAQGTFKSSGGNGNPPGGNDKSSGGNAPSIRRLNQTKISPSLI